MENATKVGKAVLKALKKEMKPVVDLKEKALKFYTEELGLKVVKKGFKVTLPLKTGSKQFEAVKFDNGKTAVYCRGNSYLKYAWA